MLLHAMIADAQKDAESECITKPCGGLINIA
jgi:hypothetical protein